MREVACFLSPTIYKANQSSFVEGLQKNGIHVECLEIADGAYNYEEKVREHKQRLVNHEGYFCQQFVLPPQHDVEHQTSRAFSQPDYSNFLCMAWEDSRQGIRAALNAGMCVLGIGSNNIELERLQAQGAYAVALSVSDMLEQFRIRNYYQIQYLPYAIYLKTFRKKVGYPASLLDTLCGRFVRPHLAFDGVEEQDDLVDSELVGMEEECRVVLDPNSRRIIPRDVLGIEPGSLADVYINNVGWPADKVPTYRFHTRGLEMDIVRIFNRYYRIPTGTMRGFVTTGGTEGNFTGIWWQRDQLRKVSNGEGPILVASEQAHYSIRKAAQQLDIEIVTVATDDTGGIDCKDLERTLENQAMTHPARPVLMVVNLGTTQTGAIDDLPMVHSLLSRKVPNQCFSIHADAASLGAILPIIKPFGPNVNYFSDWNVKTIAISGHKFFGSVTICGLLLTTESFLNECFNPNDVGVEYVSGLHDIIPSGSRNGFHVVSFHNTICGLYMHTDCRRLRAIVHQCYRNVEIFVNGMRSLVGIDKIIQPKFSLQVCFPRPSENLMIKYSLMPVNLRKENRIPLAGVCILINVTEAVIEHFMKDYARDEAVQEHIIISIS